MSYSLPLHHAVNSLGSGYYCRNAHCRPLPHNWGLPIQSGHFCFKVEHFMIIIAAVGAGLEVVTWLTPHYVV